MGVADATTGKANYTEDDVKTAARVFTGWNLVSGQEGTLTIGTTVYSIFQYAFSFNSRAHDTAAKAFTFPIYPDGTQTIPPRDAALGLQDGLDFLAGLVQHPSTATRLATKLYQFFVNDIAPPAAGPVSTIAGWLRSTDFDMKAVMRNIFLSDFFLADENFFARYRWPVEHLIGVLKTLGPGTTPLVNYVSSLDAMNEKLYDPPTVEGYKGGATWINASTMLARANIVLTPLQNHPTDFVTQVTNAGPGVTGTAAAFVDYWLRQFGITKPDPAFRDDLISFVASGSGVGWSGTANQVRAKTQALIHLIGGSAEFVFA
jgi:uncharacterized protein (DUF1800 family)